MENTRTNTIRKRTTKGESIKKFSQTKRSTADKNIRDRSVGTKGSAADRKLRDRNVRTKSSATDRKLRNRNVGTKSITDRRLRDRNIGTRRSANRKLRDRNVGTRSRDIEDIIGRRIKRTTTIDDGKSRISNIEKEKRNGSSIIIFYGVRLCFLFVTCVLILFLLLDYTKIKDMEIETGSHYASKEIKDMVVNDFFSKNTVWLFLKYRYQKQKNIPFVEYIDVELVNKNKVKVVVYDKDIIGCVEYMGNIIYFDKDGYFVETSSKIQGDTPIISGINFSDITLHEKMHVENNELFNTIMNLTQQISKYKLDIDKISFDSTYEVSLYSGDIEIMLGKNTNYNDKLAQLPDMLKEAKAEGLTGVLHLENYKDKSTDGIFKRKE